MRAVGVVDYLGLTSALAQHTDKILSRYTNILVDEAQDFGTTELRIIRRLVSAGPNDLFLCGDVAQTVLPKHRALKEAQIEVVTRERIVQKAVGPDMVDVYGRPLRGRFSKSFTVSEAVRAPIDRSTSRRGTSVLRLSTATSLSKSCSLRIWIGRSSGMGP
jgi:hypothetical protein